MRKSVIVLASAVFAVVTIAAPALAGGQPKPAPGWIGPFIIGILVLSATVFSFILASGAVQRRERR